MNEPRELPRGCAWAIVIVIALLCGFTITAELARLWVWIKWAVE